MPFAPSFTTRFAARAICMTCWLFIVSGLVAQTLTVTDDSQTVASLASGTVATLTGRAELHVTGTGDPIPSATINLNSSDAWFFLDNIRPATVTSTFLARIKVSGASAVSGTNVRVVEYGVGTVVIPHPSSFQPLQVFTGPCFTGNSVNLSQYTYYNTAAALGTMNRTISSFKLKRGYSATFAQNANGSGTSRVFVAQDGDIQIGVMPIGLQNSAAFVRVVPWRWTGKKGWAGAVQPLVDPLWSYDWDNSTSSTPNTEYVPMRHNSTWNAYSNIDSKQSSTHALGFNEPDKVDQANMTVEAALAQWPNLLKSGLRLGAPAPSDAGTGLTWLYDFIDAAKAANLRVDYVPVHFYKGNWSSSQLYSWLKSIHDRTGLPVWVTEFNNGANWTDTTELPSLASNASEINGFLDVMNSAPFVERYSIYNWVGATRMMVDDAGALTPAGIVYRDKASPIAYVQAMPPAVGRGIAQLPLDGDAIDNSGYGNNSLAVGVPSYVTGHRGQAVQLDGGNYLQLPGSVANSASFSFSAWVLWNGGSDNQRIFDFGNDTTQFIYLCPGSGGKMRFGVRNGSAATATIETSALASGAWHHVAVTMSGTTAKIYLDGVLQVSGTITTPTVSATDYNYIGKSQWPADPLFNGLLDDVRLADSALSATQIAALVTDTPPQFSSTALTGSAATQGQAYSGTVAGSATDTNPGDTVSYAKASGPGWLQVSANGVLSGTPTFNDEGAQEFTLSATDAAGATHFTVLSIQLPTVVLGNGTWTSDSNANWSDTTKWYGAFPANGAGNSANFSAINITADRTVTLNGSRSIGTLSFGDTSGTQNWRLDSASGAVLTLDTGTTTSPSLVVNQNTVTLATPLAGVNGFAKSGAGTLALAAASSLSGTVYIDTNSTTTAEGIVRATHPDALDLVTTIQIRDNNAGSSTLELDGTLGGIITQAALTLSGRNNTVVSLRNIAGDNSITGGLTLNAGGGNYYLQSDAGTLTLGGSLTSLATGSRILTFSGTGNFTLSGPLSNGSATTGISITKNGAGILTLSAANTHTGNTTVTGGSLNLTGSGLLGTGALSLASGTSLNLYTASTLSQTISGSGAIVSHGGITTLSGNFTGFTGNYTLNTGASSTGIASTASVSASARYDIAVGTASFQGIIASVASGTNTFAFGALSGVPGSILRNSLSVTASNTFQVGALNASTDFAGSIGGGGGSIAVTKVGSGTLTLSGANTYTGATTVSAGTLRINGSTAVSTVTVASAATLGGNGTVGGSVNVLAGGSLAPGAGVGTLTVAGNVVLQSGSFTRIELNRTFNTHDTLAVSGTLIYGGTLVVSNLGGTLSAGDTYTLFTSGARSGTFAALTLPTLAAGLEWDTTALTTTGILTIKALVSTYAGWSATYALPQGTSDLASDPDGDGVANAFEWLSGGDPLATNPAAGPALALRTLTDTELTGAITGKHYLTLETRVRKVFTGLTLIPEGATSLDGLSLPAAASDVSPTNTRVDDGDFEIRTFVLKTPVEDSPTGRGFLRLRVTSP